MNRRRVRSVVAFDKTTLQPVGIFDTSPNGSESRNNKGGAGANGYGVVDGSHR
jgi:hypothetical protein